MYEFDRLDFHSKHLNTSLWKSCRIMFSEVQNSEKIASIRTESSDTIVFPDVPVVPSDCWLQYYYTPSSNFNHRGERKLQVYWEEFNPDFHCPRVLSPMAVGGMVFGSIFGAGLVMILLYYFFQRYLDHKEFQQFERDIMQPSWKEENRLYKSGDGSLNGSSGLKKERKHGLGSEKATIRFRMK